MVSQPPARQHCGRPCSVAVFTTAKLVGGPRPTAPGERASLVHTVGLLGWPIPQNPKVGVSGARFLSLDRCSGIPRTD